VPRGGQQREGVFVVPATSQHAEFAGGETVFRRDAPGSHRGIAPSLFPRMPFTPSAPPSFQVSEARREKIAQRSARYAIAGTPPPARRHVVAHESRMRSKIAEATPVEEGTEVISRGDSRHDEVAEEVEIALREKQKVVVTVQER